MIFSRERERRDEGFAGLILAAGDSLRMGQPKAMLRVQGQVAAIKAARSCIAAGASKALILVARDVYDLLMERMPLGAEKNRKMQAVVVSETMRRLGPIGSIAQGVKQTMDANGWLMWPVDHPFVQTKTIEAIIDADEPIRLPTYNGRRGHPVFLNATCRDELIKMMQRGKTLRDFVRRYVDYIEDVDVSDPGIHWNCNTPSAFREWNRKFEEMHGRAPR